MGNSDPNGNLNAGILEYIHEQFDRVAKNNTKKYLTLSQVLEIHSHEDYPFDFRHLGILFVCDRELDGMFGLDNLQYFAAWIQLNLSGVQMYEFKSQLQAKTVSKIIQTLQKKDGENIISSWFLRMLLADKEHCQLNGSTYIKIESIKLLYQILNVKVMSDLDIQTFFNLVKRSSEQMGFRIQEIRQNQSDQDFQEYIQISVCKEFITHFLKGVFKILKEIGYSTNLV